MCRRDLELSAFWGAWGRSCCLLLAYLPRQVLQARVRATLLKNAAHGPSPPNRPRRSRADILRTSHCYTRYGTCRHNRRKCLAFGHLLMHEDRPVGGDDGRILSQRQQTSSAPKRTSAYPCLPGGKGKCPPPTKPRG